MLGSTDKWVKKWHSCILISRISKMKSLHITIFIHVFRTGT
jgi:hypothetical protein